MSKRRISLTVSLASMGLAWYAMVAVSCHAADHLDAPNLMGGDDINDLYAFQSPSNASNIVLILTTNPFAGQASGTTFSTDVAYEFQIDNNGDSIADLTFSTTFGSEAAGKQAYTTTLNGAPFLTGSTGNSSSVSAGGSTMQANLFDDPFFFDLVGFQNTLDPTSMETFTGTDAFAGANVSAIVLEVPSSEFDGPNLGVWARTVVGGNQVDRIGRPAINTVLIPSSRKQAFNEADPANDPSQFAADLQAMIEGLNGGDTATAADLTAILLPDVLTIDVSSSAGFLNGRQLADDVIDAELGLLTNNAITGDGVAGNDVPFSTAFPYLAPANVIPEPTSLLLAAWGLAIGGGWRRRRRSGIGRRPNRPPIFGTANGLLHLQHPCRAGLPVRAMVDRPHQSQADKSGVGPASTIVVAG